MNESTLTLLKAALMAFESDNDDDVDDNVSIQSFSIDEVNAEEFKVLGFEGYRRSGQSWEIYVLWDTNDENDRTWEPLEGVAHLDVFKQWVGDLQTCLKLGTVCSIFADHYETYEAWSFSLALESFHDQGAYFICDISSDVLVKYDTRRYDIASYSSSIYRWL